MITNIRWMDRELSSHKTIKKFETAVETAEHNPSPANERATNNDRITFSNGYSIEERSYKTGLDESGVLYFKSPEGKTAASDQGFHFIEADGATDYQPAVYSKAISGTDETWQQSFPEEGGMTFKLAEPDFYHPEFSISPDGKLSATAYNDLTGKNEPVEAHMDGKALVTQSGDSQFAVVPPVPAEWFLS